MDPITLGPLFRPPSIRNSFLTLPTFLWCFLSGYLMLKVETGDLRSYSNKRANDQMNLPTCLKDIHQLKVKHTP